MRWRRVTTDGHLSFRDRWRLSALHGVHVRAARFRATSLVVTNLPSNPAEAILHGRQGKGWEAHAKFALLHGQREQSRLAAINLYSQKGLTPIARGAM